MPIMIATDVLEIVFFRQMLFVFYHIHHENWRESHQVSEVLERRVFSLKR
jgi:hypothetical protein